MSARAQPGSALAAAVLDNPCATHGAHPLHEAVDAAAVTLFWLVCPLDVVDLSSTYFLIARLLQLCSK
jgi:hypothetical protein